MKDSNELFKLCKQVYADTGWDTGHYFKPLKPGGRSSNYPPRYDSDYLLEKLPWNIQNGDNVPHEDDSYFLEIHKNGISYGADYTNIKDETLFGEHDSTPLKALLKLCLRLHEEGLL